LPGDLISGICKWVLLPPLYTTTLSMHVAGCASVSVKWTSFHRLSPASHPLAHYRPASVITSTPASIMFPKTASLSLLLPCLHLLLYRSRSLSLILLQSSNPANPPPLRTLPLPLTLISQLPSLPSFPTNLHPSSLLRSVSRLLPASVPTMSVPSPSPNCCPVTQPRPSSSKRFPVLPRLPLTPRLVLPAALSNLAPILSTISLISIFSLPSMLLPLPPNLSPVRWYTQSLQLDQFFLPLIGSQRMTRTPTPSLCCNG
jgi:hypothetical protein